MLRRKIITCATFFLLVPKWLAGFLETNFGSALFRLDDYRGGTLILVYKLAVDRRIMSIYD
jgi:hypothetical protein